ncbi:ankyrin repeat protein [Acanthamoeba polyphaga moumouvirus]|uniref:Ankyrin repeat protein n=2 Tax=Moumouvirus TaxID=3080801 RepID=L7RCH0_9VIRU|nr:ankyrin repeat protein [Acanthamoeba polyphaga moumouvirus]AGC01987.1 ankyrin repeat protein [Acanthamoeba polyphaga moumouvirus]
MENVNDDFHSKMKHLDILFKYIKNNNEEEFIKYIDSLKHGEVDVNSKDENGNYLIFFAIIMNNEKILKTLIEYGSRLDVFDPEGYGVLYYPIKFGYQKILDILLNSDKKTVGVSLVNLKDLKGVIPLSYSIKYKNIYAIKQLLDKGADANYKSIDNMNALHLAILRKDIDIVKLIINYIKNINSRTLQGSTALHFACSFQLYDMVELLLNNGADQNIIELEYDFQPIFYSVIQNNVAITKLLIDSGANPNYQDYLGNTIIHYCVIDNHIEILDYIINKYNIECRDTNIFIEDINDKETETDYKIDPNIVNIDGLSIIHLMLYNYNENYNKYIKKIIPFANLNYQDNLGNTPLHILVEKNIWRNFSDTFNYKKINIYIRNNNGTTVFDLVPLNERNIFLDIITTSYYNYLKRYNNGWLLKWQNECSSIELKELDEKKCLDLIRNEILNEKISLPVKKNKTNITIIQDEIVEFSSFVGSLLDVFVGFKYLTKKYPNTTSLFHSQQDLSVELKRYYQTMGIQENINQHLIHFEIKWIFQRFFAPPNFEELFLNILRSKKYKYIIIPINITLSNGNHSNGLIYNIDQFTMERFEPHGANYPYKFNYNPDLLDEIIYQKVSNILTTMYGKNIKLKYYKPNNYLPKIGFQTLENTEISVNKNIGDPNGFCTLWTIWYFDYRIRYGNKNAYRLANNLIKEIKINNYSFRTIIRNYSKNITDLRDAYLSQINRTVNDYLNNKFSISETKNLLNVILNDNAVYDTYI